MPAGPRGSRTRKTPDRTLPAGPPPTATSSAPAAFLPPREARLRQHDPWPGPVGTATDRRCLRLLTSMQRDCDTVNPLVAARSVRRGFFGRFGVPAVRRRGSWVERTTDSGHRERARERMGDGPDVDDRMAAQRTAGQPISPFFSTLLEIDPPDTGRCPPSTERGGTSHERQGRLPRSRAASAVHFGRDRRRPMSGSAGEAAQIHVIGCLPG